MPLALYVLTVAAFAIGTTEFVIMGLLPEVAIDLGITLPQAGLLVTAYAMGVVVGGPLLAMLTAKLPKRAALLGLFALFIAGNGACALAPSYLWLTLARILTAFTHGTFLGVAGVVACHLVPKERQARANGLIFSGITLANVLGVPAGIAIGQAYGWRVTFVAVALVALGATVALFLLLPAIPKQAEGRISDEFIVFRDPRVLASLALSVASSASLLCLLTFLTPYLTGVVGINEARVTSILFLFGLGLTIGTTIGGHLGDRDLLGSIIFGLSGAMATLLLLPFAAPSMVLSVGVLFLWGMFAFGLCPMLHTLVMRSAAIAPTLASTLNHSAFNLGNAIGAWLGSVALSHGQPISHLPYTCFGLAMLAMALAFALRGLSRRAEQRRQHAIGLLPPASLAAIEPQLQVVEPVREAVASQAEQPLQAETRLTRHARW